MMMRFQRGLLRLLLASVLLPGLAAVPALAGDLVVGIASNYPPLAFKRDGKITGIEADNAREVGASLGRRVRLVEMPFADLLSALQAGKVDVLMSGLSVTPQRRQQVAFARPFMTVGQMAIIRSQDIARFGHPRAIYAPGVRVGVEAGTTGQKYASESMPDARVQTLRDSREAFAALRAGRIDVFIHDAPTSWGIAEAPENADLFSLYRLLTREDLAWAVRKDDQQLLAALNRARDQLDKSGRLQAIQNFWIPIKVEVH